LPPVRSNSTTDISYLYNYFDERKLKAQIVEFGFLSILIENGYKKRNPLTSWQTIRGF